MDRDINTSEQPMPPPSALRVHWDRIKEFIPAGIFLLALFTAITLIISYQSDLKSEIKRVEQKVDTFQQVMMVRLDSLEAIFSTKVESLEKENEKLQEDQSDIEVKVDDNADKLDENAQSIDAIKQTLNEASQ